MLKTSENPGEVTCLKLNISVRNKDLNFLAVSVILKFLGHAAQMISDFRRGLGNNSCNKQKRFGRFHL